MNIKSNTSVVHRHAIVATKMSLALITVIIALGHMNQSRPHLKHTA
jgi:hypothetical protein